MIKSMTAYGRAECELGTSKVLAEVKSLNNRHRDIILRIPVNLRPLEDELKSVVSSRVRRGRVAANARMLPVARFMPVGLSIAGEPASTKSS